MKKLLALVLCALLLVSLAACTQTPAADPQPEPTVTEPEPAPQPEPAPEEADAQTADPLTPEAKGATAITEQINAEVYQLLDFSDEQEGEFAARGFMTAPDTLTITGAAGNTVWSQDAYDFARDAEAPASANPSLWRNTQYNTRYGLFQVTDDIYQVRGYDVSNLTFVRSDHGWIVLDCMSSADTARAALELFESQLGEAHISAIIISHAHADHYGGIEGLIAREDLADASLPLDEQLASGKTAVIVPAGFADSVMSENVFVGTAMKRRSMYQYGSVLRKGEQGSLSVGIGLTVVQSGVG